MFDQKKQSSVLYKMAALDMDTVSKYLERSMQNCSLSNQIMSFEDGFGVTDESEGDHIPIIDRTLELNSHIPVPYHLEQCLDLKVTNTKNFFFCLFSFFLSRFKYSLASLYRNFEFMSFLYLVSE